MKQKRVAKIGNFRFLSSMLVCMPKYIPLLLNYLETGLNIITQKFPGKRGYREDEDLISYLINLYA